MKCGDAMFVVVCCCSCRKRRKLVPQQKQRKDKEKKLQQTQPLWQNDFFLPTHYRKSIFLRKNKFFFDLFYLHVCSVNIDAVKVMACPMAILTFWVDICATFSEPIWFYILIMNLLCFIRKTVNLHM